MSNIVPRLVRLGAPLTMRFGPLGHSLFTYAASRFGTNAMTELVRPTHFIDAQLLSGLGVDQSLLVDYVGKSFLEYAFESQTTYEADIHQALLAAEQVAPSLLESPAILRAFAKYERALVLLGYHDFSSLMAPSILASSRSPVSMFDGFSTEGAVAVPKLLHRDRMTPDLVRAMLSAALQSMRPESLRPGVFASLLQFAVVSDPSIVVECADSLFEMLFNSGNLGAEGLDDCVKLLLSAVPNFDITHARVAHLISERPIPAGVLKLLLPRVRNYSTGRSDFWTQLVSRGFDSAGTCECAQTVLDFERATESFAPFAPDIENTIILSFVNGCVLRCSVSVGERIPLKVTRESRLLGILGNLMNASDVLRRIDAVTALARAFQGAAMDGSHADLVFDALFAMINARIQATASNFYSM
jgi:hypothetical protein